MRFPRPCRPARPANIVPMINIVFLLLIFFLLTATLAPPDPFEVTSPAATGEAAADAGTATLHVAADGRLAYRDLRDEDVFAALAASAPDALVLRADAGLDGAAFARLVGRLAGLGIPDLSLVVMQP